VSTGKTCSACLQVFIISVVVFISFGIKAVRGDSFQNLGFESAVIGTPVYFRLPASEALPGWTIQLGGTVSNFVVYDTIALDSPCVSIQDKSGYIKPLTGNYSVILQDGADPWGNTYTASISQTGDVPDDAKSLMFKSDMTTYINELQVSINGTVIPFTLYSTAGTVNSSYGPVRTYICDVSAYADETVTLEFEKRVHDVTHPNQGIVDLDAIAFSTTPAPEPSSLVLLVVGVLTLFGYRSYRRRCRQS
jgi:hypothetical protein